MTPRESPREAMMNATSPICAMENPHRRACFRGCPESRYPKEPLSNKKQSEVIVATEDMSDEQKQILTDQFFANLEEMQHQFNQTHNVQTGDGE